MRACGGGLAETERGREHWSRGGHVKEEAARKEEGRTARSQESRRGGRGRETRERADLAERRRRRRDEIEGAESRSRGEEEETDLLCCVKGWRRGVERGGIRV